MIIFFGTRTSHIKSRELEYETCPSCGQQNSLLCSVHGKYAHIFWIPIFPMLKTVSVQCRQCGCAMDVYQMPPGMKESALRFRKNTRMPVWYFAGLFLLAGLLGLLIFSQQMIKKEMAAYLADPQIHDCYYIRYSEDGYFSTMRIEEITEDSVYFVLNEYTTNKRSGIDQINVEENFEGGDWLPVAKEDLDLKNIESLSLEKIRRN